jgi:hypothetical protein
LRALPSLEQFREHLRETERDEDLRRRERVGMLKSRVYGKNFGIESMELAQAAEEMISQFEGK